MVVNYMPSNRSGGKVSKRVANEYETLDGGVPSLDNNNGPYRSKELFEKWNDGVLKMMRKYQDRLKTNQYIVYGENGQKRIETSKAPVTKFINDMLNDSKATGKEKQQHQTDYLEAYFNIKDEYIKQYKDKNGDVFKDAYTTNTKGDTKETATVSKSGEASFTAKKSDGTEITKVIVSKMRDGNAGYAFSFRGTISGYNKYDGKKATLYCLGVKTYGRDYVLFKMSFNNDWYINAYNGAIKYTPEQEETSRTYPVFLMLLPYDATIRGKGSLVAKIMPCIPGDKINEGDVYNLKVTDIEDVRILQGKDGYMMKMNHLDKKKKATKDVFYDKDETFNNILSMLTRKKEE